MKEKSKKNPYPRTFAGRLSRMVIFSLSIVMLIIITLLFITTMYVVMLFRTDSYQYAQKYSSEYVQRVISDVYVGTVNNAHDVEAHITQPDSLLSIMERIVRLNPRIRSCGVSFVENYYPQKGRWYFPYALRRDNSNIEKLTISNEQYDYLNQEWFKETLQSEKGYWSKPFFDEYDNTTPLISYLQPIHDRQGKTVAVLNVGLSLNFLTEKLKNIYKKINEEDSTDPDNARRATYSFIIDSEGTYIAHPDQERILKKNFFDYAKQSEDSLVEAIGRKMIAKEATEFEPEEINIEGINSYIIYATIKHTDWSMATVVPAITVKFEGIAFCFIILSFLGFGLLVAFIVCFLMIDKNTKPLIMLAASTDEVAKGKFDTLLPDIHTRDEIQRLHDSFIHMQQSLAKYIEELKATTSEKASIERELVIAHNIQMAMLPKVFPPYPERHDIDIYGQLKPAKAVGGDLFDFYIREEKLFFCIGDVSGKGVPASLVMAVTRSLFRNVSAHEEEPEEIIKSLNNAMAEGNDTNMFVTLFVGVLDITTGKLSYCNAGHDAPLLIGDGMCLLKCDSNIPVGVLPEWEFSHQEAVIKPKTTIFLYTDGLTEAEDINHAQFGEERILDVARPYLTAGSHQPKALIDAMTEAVHEFVGEAEQSDDLTMLAIQYCEEHGQVC